MIRQAVKLIWPCINIYIYNTHVCTRGENMIFPLRTWCGPDRIRRAGTVAGRTEGMVENTGGGGGFHYIIILPRVFVLRRGGVDVDVTAAAAADCSIDKTTYIRDRPRGHVVVARWCWRRWWWCVHPSR